MDSPLCVCDDALNFSSGIQTNVSPLEAANYRGTERKKEATC